MTIEQPTKNVALTFEQMEQIEKAKATLSNIESEVTIATRNLGIINKDVLKATKEREYQEQLLADTVEPIAKARKELSRILEEIDVENISLARIRKEESESIDRQTNKASELSDREAKIKSSEESMAVRMSAFDAEEKKQAAEREKLESAKAAFIVAIETITWKSSKE